MKKCLVGITMGDPAGNGPELCAKVLLRKEIYDICIPIIVGDAMIIEKALKLIHADGIRINRISDTQEALGVYGTIDVYHMDLIDPDRLRVAQVSAECGCAAYLCVEKVIELGMAGKLDATVTNALNKEALHLAGYNYSGHTEIYADLTQTKNYAMMLAFHDMRVVHVTTHVSLRKACEQCRKERILDVIRLTDQMCKSIGITSPRIGVNGLNPHAGENGLFGDEEIWEIIPACKEAAQAGIDVYGPLPPDSAFSKMKGGWYDAIVCMYHDQGHIPLKLEGFRFNRTENKWEAVEGVNITLGLPIIRVSVDHGTGFEIAWKGISSDVSLKNSIEYAAKLAAHKQIDNELGR